MVLGCSPWTTAPYPSNRRSDHRSGRHSGFSVDASPTVWPQDVQGIERLARYLLRCPVSLSRIHWTPGARTLFYQAKASHDDPFAKHPDGESLDIFAFIARVLTQIPEPRIHGVRYFGAYSSKARARRNAEELQLQPSSSDHTTRKTDEPRLSSKQRTALRRRWAHLIKRVFKTDPLVCPDCGGELRILSFITEPKIISKILDHLHKRNTRSRAPPRHNFHSDSQNS